MKLNDDLFKTVALKLIKFSVINLNYIAKMYIAFNLKVKFIMFTFDISKNMIKAQGWNFTLSKLVLEKGLYKKGYF